MIRLILADDHRLIRDGIKALLSDDEMVITGEAATGLELVELLTFTFADMVLLDISMPEMDGFECLRYLRQQHPHLKVLVLSMMENERYVQQVLELGAHGYVLKNAGKDELRAAIRLVANGTPYISPLFAMNRMHSGNERTPGPALLFYKGATLDAPTHKDLSKRELEVLHLIAEGFTNADIAEQLFTSRRTIETHRQNLLEKTRTRNTAALIRYAMQHGIIC